MTIKDFSYNERLKQKWFEVRVHWLQLDGEFSASVFLLCVDGGLALLLVKRF